jgi:hypothetical protein
MQPGEELGQVGHTITHHRIRATVRRASLLAPGARGGWVRAAELADLGLSGLARKVLRLASSEVQPTSATPPR